MTEEELKRVFAQHTAAIIAPAGHGKTEMITEMVQYSDGKQLLLTHTNAGVDALRKRLKRKNISSNKYTVETIAAFCMKWCKSYKNTAGCDGELPLLANKDDTDLFYKNLYEGTRKVFATAWAGKVLRTTYAGVIVDEYQDCIVAQHQIMLMIACHVPIRVLGDSLQGIFNFGKNILVDWNTLEFPIIAVETKPWRWYNSNRELGEYLSSVRCELEPSLLGRKCSIHIDNKHVEIISSALFNGYSLLKDFERGASVVYITKWPSQQMQFCRSMAGIFQNDEVQDCKDLFECAKILDGQQYIETLYLAIIDFASKCMTQVNAALSSYIGRLRICSYNFSRIKKYPEFGELLLRERESDHRKAAKQVILWLLKNVRTFKPYRLELILEMKRALEYATNHEISVYEAINHIRRDVGLQRRYTNFRFLSSRTLLSKGLEFDYVIIDMRNPLSVRDFYVAMTRAMKKIYIISDTDTFAF